MVYTQGGMIALSCVLLLVPTVFVTLRVVARRMCRAGLSWDDYTIFSALVFSIASCICQLIASTKGRLGQHQITHPDGSPIMTDAGFVVYEKAKFALEIFSTLSVGWAKASVILFYMRIFETTKFRLVRQLFLIIVTAWTVAFIYSFSQAPSPETDAVWASLFPEGLGFVKHPTIAPSFSGLVVFHELHCVNILREAYYAAVDGSLNHSTDEQEVPDQNHRANPHHVRHCFDYLRQGIMCASDTNLEPVDEKLMGVTGWGFWRTCRDFEAVKEWAEENRATGMW